MANVLRGTCAHDCSTTWWRTNDVATGPGEVRRCEHGNLWVWSHRENSALDITSFDRWRRLRPRRDRREYRRAVAALEAAEDG